MQESWCAPGMFGHLMADTASSAISSKNETSAEMGRRIDGDEKTTAKGRVLATRETSFQAHLLLEVECRRQCRDSHHQTRAKDFKKKKIQSVCRCEREGEGGGILRAGVEHKHTLSLSRHKT